MLSFIHLTLDKGASTGSRLCSRAKRWLITLTSIPLLNYVEVDIRVASRSSAITFSEKIILGVEMTSYFVLVVKKSSTRVFLFSTKITR